MKMHQITAAVALIGIGIGVSGCDISNSVAATNAADAAPAAVVHDGKLVTLPATSPLRHSVRSEVAASMALEHPFGAPGTIEAAPEKLVKVTSPLTGRLIKIHHTLGDRVNAGDPLFTLDSSDLSTAFGDASKAQAALLSAQQNLERQKPCMKPRSFPKRITKRHKWASPNRPAMPAPASHACGNWASVRRRKDIAITSCVRRSPAMSLMSPVRSAVTGTTSMRR